MEAVIIYLACGVVWGLVVNKIIQNKGYSENWFWWGFFFGIFALIAALIKPDISQKTTQRPEEQSYWQCKVCGTRNSDYVGTCKCGNTRANNYSYEKSKIEQENAAARELNNLNMLNGYKDLLDQGVITQEEFEEKKKHLL